MEGCLPVRVASVTVVRPPRFFGAAWASVAGLVAGPKLRQRTTMLHG